jgi:hypothetical protein
MRFDSTNRRLARPLRSVCDGNHKGALFAGELGCEFAQLTVVARKGAPPSAYRAQKPRFGFSEAGFRYWTRDCPWRSVDCGAGGRHSAPLIAACSKGARKSPARCKESGAAGLQQTFTEASSVFRSKAIRGAGIGSRKKKPRRMTGLKTVMHGATQRSLKQSPTRSHSQHVQIGAGYNSLGHDSARLPSALTAVGACLL